MFLAIVNEDILPSYTVLFAAMALASVWFARPTAARVAAVAVLFSIAWLMEWRLMFPTLPAMLAALWLCEERPARRLGWIALFLAGMVATACIVAWAWRGHEGAVGPIDLLWTGKAVRSVWAGFTWPKVGYLWDGMVAYLLGAGVAAIPGIPGWDIWRYTSTVWMVAVAAVALPMLWRARHDPRARALARDLRRHFRGRRRLQSLFPAAGSADADQRHGLADGRLGAGAGGGAAALRRPRPGGAGRAHGGAVRLQCLEPGAAARAGQRLAAGDRAPGARGRSLAHRLADARFRLGDGLWLAALGQRRARQRHAGACAAGRPQVQVDRLHRPGAAPSRLERRAAGGRPAAPDRSRAGAGLRRAGGAAVGHGPGPARGRDRHGGRQPPPRGAARPVAQRLRRHAWPSPIPSPARCTASSAGRVARPRRPARRQSGCVASSCGTDRHRGPPDAWCSDCPRTRSSRFASGTGR